METTAIEKAIEEHTIEQTKIINQVRELKKTKTKPDRITEFKLSLLYFQYDLHNHAINELKKSLC
ncbi:hypothetical protein [Flavobacterium sp.]|uniref:hypothetical protein n=1 Tax=Flavobacterium sp. TaxID=239 RepID=UPI0025BBFFBA|nr:hypothetical protein [Flavobacterium sp.]